jgi:hypothetical protein
VNVFIAEDTHIRGPGKIGLFFIPTCLSPWDGHRQGAHSPQAQKNVVKIWSRVLGSPGLLGDLTSDDLFLVSHVTCADDPQASSL